MHGLGRHCPREPCGAGGAPRLRQHRDPALTGPIPAGATLVVYNPVAGRRRGRAVLLARFVDALRRRGLHAEVRATAGPGDAARLSGEACAAGVWAVVVLGGDGTVNETMQPMVGSATPLAVWPGGTANVLAAEQRLPADVERAASMVAAGRTRRVSVGRAGKRYFLLMAGVGIDAAVVRSVNPRIKRLLGQGAYLVAGACLLARWHPARFTVEAGGRRYPATFAVVANAASYGGGLRIAPHADMERDRLALCLFDWTARRRFLAHLPAALAGRRVDAPGVTYLDASRATASGDDTVWVQVDGEALGPLPMSFESVPAALSLIVP